MIELKILCYRPILTDSDVVETKEHGGVASRFRRFCHHVCLDRGSRTGDAAAKSVRISKVSNKTHTQSWLCQIKHGEYHECVFVTECVDQPALSFKIWWCI